MPEEHDKRADFGEPDDFTEADEFDDLDDLDDDDEPGDTGRAWPAPGYPPGGYPDPPGGWRRNGGDRTRRGLLLAVTALVAGATGFGVVAVAVHDAAAVPTAAGSTPSSTAPDAGGTPAGGAGSGNQRAPVAGGAVPSIPSGATLRLEIGGPVTAVSATSITLGGGDREVTAAVTKGTKVTGKVTSIGGVKVGDVVSASITGTNGQLTVTSIQDPASLPSAPAQ